MSDSYYSYSVQRKCIDRHYDPSRRDLDGHIKKMWLENVGKITAREPINTGDVIMLDGEPFTVIEKIFTSSKRVLRVADYRSKSIHYHGSDSWMEESPLFPDGFSFAYDFDTEKPIEYDGKNLQW